MEWVHVKLVTIRMIFGEEIERINHKESEVLFRGVCEATGVVKVGSRENWVCTGRTVTKIVIRVDLRCGVVYIIVLVIENQR